MAIWYFDKEMKSLEILKIQHSKPREEERHDDDGLEKNTCALLQHDMDAIVYETSLA